jgi:LytR cell envelope-related transcriptional attenuator
MGRHSSEQRASFYRSVLAWGLPWLVIAAIVGVAVWFAVGALSGSEVTPSTGPQQGGSQDPSVTPESPTPSVTETPDDSATKAPKSPSPDGDGDLITADVSVQVLNGTGGVAGAAESMATRLRRRGYEIAAVGDGLTVDRTVVFWSGSEDERAALALARNFGWSAGPAPSNLSDVVDIHVIVGPDEASG